MHSFHEFFTMGGYAVYVWPAYAVALVVFVVGGWQSRRGLRRALSRAERRAREVSK